MLIPVMIAKLHGLSITETNLHYQGSIGVGVDLLEAASLYENQKVQVVNIQNGERLETYIIPCPPGAVTLNGAAARKAMVGDTILVIAYGLIAPSEAKDFNPILLFPQKNLLS